MGHPRNRSRRTSCPLAACRSNSSASSPRPRPSTMPSGGSTTRFTPMARLRAYSFYDDIAGDLERVEATGVGALLRKVENVHLIEATKYSHLHPLSILPILDYILRKDREVQNIRLIARGKESGLSTDVIRELLVV